MFFKIKITATFVLIFSFMFTGSVSAYSVINAHEHIQSLQEAKKLIPLMNQFKIKATAIVGSPEQTFFPPRVSGTKFTNYDANNEQLLKIIKEFPDRFLAFCIGYPEDPELINKIKNCMENGATGAKLLSGHGTFHTIPLNDPSLDGFYSYLETERIPLIWHVNSGKYQEEFEGVLRKYPRLKIICPHFCMASKSPSRFTHLMDAYPNLYTDMSFGGVVEEGFKTVSDNIENFKKLLEKYQDRILFGTDFVITTAKTEKRIWNNIRAYKNQAERNSFKYLGKTYKGLKLNKQILKKVYETNWKNFMQAP